MGRDTAEAVIAADIARALSPATIDTLEDDLAVGDGLAYRFLSQRARSILGKARSANPVCHGNVWAFDIDGFVFLTNVPHRGKTLREAREILESALRRSLEVCAPKPTGLGLASASLPRPTRPDVAGGPTAGKGRRPGKANEGGARDRKAEPPHVLEALLGQAHYTRIPAWLLDGSLPLSVSQRILLADILDVMGGGAAESYEADRARIERRSGLGASTASWALRELTAQGVLARVEGCRGRYTLSWEALAALARTGTAAAETIGHARALADIRRRLCDPAGSLAVPSWAVECCGATHAALLLSKAWAYAHAHGDGVVWASGLTLARWLPGCDRPLRRARASLAQRGLVSLTPQHRRMRAYASGSHLNRTSEFRIDAKAIVRALLVRGHDFGDLAAVARELFADDSRLCRDAAAWDARETAVSRARSLAAARAHRGTITGEHWAATQDAAPNPPYTSPAPQSRKRAAWRLASPARGLQPAGNA